MNRRSFLSTLLAVSVSASLVGVCEAQSPKPEDLIFGTWLHSNGRTVTIGDGESGPHLTILAPKSGLSAQRSGSWSEKGRAFSLEGAEWVLISPYSLQITGPGRSEMLTRR